MIVQLRLPPRPAPNDPKAKLVLEWAEVAFYILVLICIGVALVLGLVEAPSLLSRSL